MSKGCALFPKRKVKYSGHKMPRNGSITIFSSTLHIVHAKLLHNIKRHLYSACLTQSNCGSSNTIVSSYPRSLLYAPYFLIIFYSTTYASSIFLAPKYQLVCFSCMSNYHLVKEYMDKKETYIINWKYYI